MTRGPVGRRRVLLVGVGGLLAAALVVGLVVVSIRATDRSPTGRQAGSRPSAQGSPTATPSRLEGISRLLQRRADALRRGDAAQLVATVDPQRPALRRAQRRLLTDLRPVPATGWSYTVDTRAGVSAASLHARFGPTAYAPAGIELHYRLRGFDVRPVAEVEYPVFVHRAAGWLIASFDAGAPHGAVSTDDLWDAGPVRVLHDGPVLAIGARSETTTLRDAAALLRQAFPAVDAVWGRSWRQRVVLQIPATQAGVTGLTGDARPLTDIAALTSAEISSGEPPGGDRVTVNPGAWPRLSEIGRAAVLTHELTHVASRAATTDATPDWLAEGLADFVAYRAVHVSLPIATTELRAELQADGLPAQLPTNAAFATGGQTLASAYEQAWLACRLIATTLGAHTLVRFYRAVGRTDERPGPAVAAAMHSVLHTSPTAFTAAWRHSLATLS